MNQIRNRKAVIIVFLLHLVAVIVFAFYERSVSQVDAQSQLLWIFWIPVDFPVSLLVILVFFASGEGGGNWNLIVWLAPYVVHGLLGSLWWAYWANLLFLRLSKKKMSQKSRAQITD